MSSTEIPLKVFDKWIFYWNKMDNTCNIGFDLFMVLIGIRDCILIDHKNWVIKRKQKILINIINKLKENNEFKCLFMNNNIGFFYFEYNLFIYNKILMIKRIEYDLLNNLNEYIFMNVSDNIKSVTILNECKNVSNICPTKIQELKKIINEYKIEIKRNIKKNIIKLHLLDKKYANFGVTLCGYFINFPLIYYSLTNSNNLNNNQHKIILIKYLLKYNNKLYSIKQFSLPNTIYYKNNININVINHINKHFKHILKHKFLKYNKNYFKLLLLNDVLHSFIVM